MKSYKKYKDTKIAWVERVPEHWEIAKFKTVLSECKQKNENEDAVLLSVSQYTGVSIKDLEKKVGMFAAESLTGYNIVNKNNLVMNIMLAWNGAMGVSQFEGVVSPSYAVFKLFNNIDPQYLHYLIRTQQMAQYFEAYSTGLIKSRLRLYPFVFKSLFTIIPPLTEQIQIAKYLDWKVSQINKVINNKKKQIELLKEYRYQIINSVISNIVGEKIKLRHIFNFNKGLSITKDDLVDQGIPCVSYGEIHSKYGFEVDPMKHNLKCVEKKYLESSPKSLLLQGDFVFADTSEDIAGSGNFTYLNSATETFAGYHTIIASPKNEMEYRFIAYYFDSVTFRSQIQKKVNGIKVYSITQTILKNCLIKFPNHDTQIEIINYLDQKCSLIDKAIDKIKEEIALLNKYKPCLISDVVTGQVNVMDVVVRDFDKVDEDIEENDEYNETF